MRTARISASLALVSAVIGLYLLLPVNSTTVALTLLMAILGISASWGLAEATIASVAAVLGLNFFFLPPVRTFIVQDPQNWLALVAFLATSVTASQLSDRARRRAAEAEARRMEIERLYELMQSMMLGGSLRRTIHEFLERVVKSFHCDGAAFYNEAAGEILRSDPVRKPVSDRDLLAAAQFADPFIDPERRLVLAPVRFGGRSLGSLALAGPPLSEETVGAIVNLVALMLERARALDEASQAEAARQSELLKTALLDSLAHDIKTPLTSIKAAATSLLSGSGGQDRELLTIIDEEADRLNRTAAEAIAMARIEAGKLRLEKRPVSAADLLSGALAEFAAPLKTRVVTVEVADSLPEAEADPEFASQVVKQFIDNALKYSPEGSPIGISAERRQGKIVIGVTDRGPGIQEEERGRIFEKFFRGKRDRFDRPGSGMGLAIAKGIVEAHGERIWVESEPDGGAAFYFSLPVSGDEKHR
jgi:two-component system, OmpR family, sensor histidine kinase KdpD